MFGRVPVGRRIATRNVPAFEAHTQVNPMAADFDAILTYARRGRREIFRGSRVFTDLHLASLRGSMRNFSSRGYDFLGPLV